jgi:hypothetical protein
MVAPAAPASLHLLTPGSPAYALLKVGAIGGVFALRFALAKRERQKRAEAESPEPARQGPEPARREPHPVSRKRKKRRRR